MCIARIDFSLMGQGHELDAGASQAPRCRCFTPRYQRDMVCGFPLFDPGNANGVTFLMDHESCQAVDGEYISGREPVRLKFITDQ